MNKKNTSLNNKLIKIFIISIIVYLIIYIFVNIYADTLKNNIERIHIIETEANNFSNNILTGDNKLPSIFHSGFDDDNHFTVRLQKNLDICFSHAIISMTESSIHKQLKEEVFLSRRHLDYISSNSDESSPYAFGRNIGSNSLAYNSLYYGLNGSGYVDEKKFKEDYLVNKLPYSEMKKDTLPFLLTDFIQFKTIEKKDMSQMTENEKTAYLNEMTNARNNIKKHILEKGIVLAQIHVDDVTPYKYGLFYGISPIHKDTMHINHSICIVGWDDTIDPKLFEDDFTNYPKQKGAWIVYDSRVPTARGLPESEPKRYYISYSDAFIEEQIFGINNIEKLDKKIKIYQHEKWGNNVTANLTEHSYEILNIFEKSTDNEEEIYGIGFNSYENHDIEAKLIPLIDSKYFNSTEDITNYISSKEFLDKPYMKSFQNSHDGYTILKTDNDSSKFKITGKKGDKFAIQLRVTNRNPNKYPNIHLPLTVKSIKSGADKPVIEKLFKYTQFKPMQTFIKLNDNFVDLYSKNNNNSLEINQTDPEKMISIRLYTKYVGNSDEEKDEKDEIKYHKVTFNTDGANEIFHEVQVKHNAKLKVEHTPTKNGYTFVRWSPDITQPITEDITFTAIWRKDSSSSNNSSEDSSHNSSVDSSRDNNKNNHISDKDSELKPIPPDNTNGNNNTNAQFNRNTEGNTTNNNNKDKNILLENNNNYINKNNTNSTNTRYNITDNLTDYNKNKNENSNITSTNTNISSNQNMQQNLPKAGKQKLLLLVFPILLLLIISFIEFKYTQNQIQLSNKLNNK